MFVLVGVLQLLQAVYTQCSLSIPPFASPRPGTVSQKCALCTRRTLWSRVDVPKPYDGSVCFRESSILPVEVAVARLGSSIVAFPVTLALEGSGRREEPKRKVGALGFRESPLRPSTAPMEPPPWVRNSTSAVAPLVTPRFPRRPEPNEKAGVVGRLESWDLAPIPFGGSVNMAPAVRLPLDASGRCEEPNAKRGLFLARELCRCVAWKSVCVA